MIKAPDNKLPELASQLSPEIANRWSPRAYSPTPVESNKLLLVLEAARWAASCFNEQPWRFVVGNKAHDPHTWQLLWDCLAPSNQVWCIHAPVLILIVAKDNFTYNNAPNRHAIYDAGQAAANMAIEAVHQGLALHQMAGFDGVKAQSSLQIPEGFTPCTMATLGYIGNPDDLPENLQKGEKSSRARKSITELAFGATWGLPF